MTRAVSVCCLLVAWIAIAPPAIADAPKRLKTEQARKLLDEGNRLYDVRAFAEAVEKFKAGAVIEPAPVFDYNLAQSYRQLGQYSEAIWHYKRYIDTGHPRAEKLAAIRGFIDQMQAELDHKAMSQPPTEMLGREPSEPAAAPTPLPAISPRSAEPRRVESNEVAADRSRGRWRWLGLALTAGGLVGGGVTTWLAVSAHSLNSDAQDPTRTSSERRDLVDRADSRRQTALVLGIGSGVALAAGVITLAIVARGPSQTSSTAWNLGFTGNGIAVLGSF